jgi:hypothetical protein
MLGQQCQRMLGRGGADVVEGRGFHDDPRVSMASGFVAIGVY